MSRQKKIAAHFIKTIDTMKYFATNDGKPSVTHCSWVRLLSSIKYWKGMMTHCRIEKHCIHRQT
jgi:hypothetical protein